MDGKSNDSGVFMGRDVEVDFENGNSVPKTPVEEVVLQINFF